MGKKGCLWCLLQQPRAEESLLQSVYIEIVTLTNDDNALLLPTACSVYDAAYSIHSPTATRPCET